MNSINKNKTLIKTEIQGSFEPFFLYIKNSNVKNVSWEMNFL